ncbi:uncharacterized protein LOC131933289 [Physella acuta]|uniref:uncharacterized protein LOC131933289 n=1 Tax=Physella acuta TaxID=109671 RepID=UPI0027DE2A63|nr:uncharacterized protein LOC131933289 [Physella acuta]
MAEAAESSSAVSKMEYNTVELPSSIEIKESVIHKGQGGAFACCLISKDTRFGPYKGEIIKAGVKRYIDYRYAWEVLEKRSNVLKHTVCAMDSQIGNWMRHVNCARFYEEQNILSTQEGFSIFYVAMKDIKPGEELLTWFDPKLLKRTKRRLSKMERKPVGYTIELVPWSDEKKFVPEIIETKRARKKKVMSDMISLDEDPVAIARTLQRLTKQAQANASKEQGTLSEQKSDSKISKQLQEKSLSHLKDKTVSKSRSENEQTSSSPYRDKKSHKKQTIPSYVSPRGVKMGGIDSVNQNNHVHYLNKNIMNDKTAKSNSQKKVSGSVRRKPRPHRSMKGNAAVTLKPIIFRINDEGAKVVEDNDETYELKNLQLKEECDETCHCLNKQLASQMYTLTHLKDNQQGFAIRFTLLPEHKICAPESKKIFYKCDICDGAYNHAFSLKRHYLGVHINHRYLTSSDIKSCQIDTFHAGVHLENEDFQEVFHLPVSFEKLDPFPECGTREVKTLKENSVSEQSLQHKEQSENAIKKELFAESSLQREYIPTLKCLAEKVVELSHPKTPNEKLGSPLVSDDKDSTELPVETMIVDEERNLQCEKVVPIADSEVPCPASLDPQQSTHSLDEDSKISDGSVVAAKNESGMEVPDLQNIRQSPEPTDLHEEGSQIVTTNKTQEFPVADKPTTSSVVDRKTAIEQNHSIQETSAFELINDQTHLENTTEDKVNTATVALKLDSCAVQKSILCAHTTEITKSSCVCLSFDAEPVDEKDSTVDTSKDICDRQTQESGAALGNSNSICSDGSDRMLTSLAPDQSASAETFPNSSLESSNAASLQADTSHSPSKQESPDPPTSSIKVSVEPEPQTNLLQHSGEDKPQTPGVPVSGISSPKNPAQVSPQQVIFVTNIVFPIVTPNKHSPTSPQLATSLPQTTSGSSKNSATVSQSQAKGMPLVLISQLPPGLNVQNATSAFLQSSTALKTLQSLQNSLNVMSLGNTATVLTNSKVSAAPLSCGSISKSPTSSSITSPILSPTGLQSVNFIQLTSPTNGQDFKILKSPTLKNYESVPSITHPLHSLAPAVRHPSLAGQPDDLYRCHMCVLLFKTLNQLKHHIKNDPHRFKGIKQYACLQCNIRFSNKTNLIRHNLMNHKEDESFKFRCLTCGKGFSTDTYLKMHERFHSGKNFPCKYGCNNIYFPNAASLVKHLRTEHAGLNLKEYLKNVKAEKSRRNKLNRIFGPSDHIRNIEFNQDKKEFSSYSINQPGIGFQAKRKQRPSKTIAQIEEERQRAKLMQEIVQVKVEPVMPKFLFKCKLCDRGFTTHLRLLQHRTNTHGASQSVQEYLYQMSKDVAEEDASGMESSSLELSPPPSPKTFYANVNRKGQENMKNFIDGGFESLQQWRKYIKVDGYTSISEPFNSEGMKDSKTEWTFYNFPPYFRYQEDCTQFYDKSDPSSEEISFNQDNKATLLETLELAKTEKTEKEEASSNEDSAVSLPEKTIKTEPVCVFAPTGDSERGNAIINKLEKRLRECNRNLFADSGSILHHDLQGTTEEGGEVFQCKTEVLSEDEESNTTDNCSNKILDKKQIDEMISADNYIVCRSIINNMVDNAIEGPAALTQGAVHEEVPGLNRLDSGFSSMPSSEYQSLVGSASSSLSSSECPSLDGCVPGSRESENCAGGQVCAGEPSPLCIGYVNPNVPETNVDSVDNSLLTTSAVQPATDCPTKAIPILPKDKKLEVLSSSFMQSINLESSLALPSKGDLVQGESSPKTNSLLFLQSLNLHVMGCQLSSAKLLELWSKGVSLTQLSSPVAARRYRTLSLSSLGIVSHGKKPQFDHSLEALNTSDTSKHDNRRYSIWSGQLHPKVNEESKENTFCCPVVETVRKQEAMRQKVNYEFEKISRDREVTKQPTKFAASKLKMAEMMGLMAKSEFELSHHAKRKNEFIIKPPEIWNNYENIWFGKKGAITVVCSICHRHFSCWDLCFRHQLKKHPHIEPASLEMERDNDVEDMYYYYPMRYGILAETQLIPDDLPPIEVYVCTRCGFPFKNLNKLHSHILACDPAQEEVVSAQCMNQKPTFMKKKLLTLMDRRLTQDTEAGTSKAISSKTKSGRSNRISTLPMELNRPRTQQSSPAVVCSNIEVPRKSKPANKAYPNRSSLSSNFSFYASSKSKNYELLYNPQNHLRRRELYKVLDQHQCHGCNLKFNSLSMLERHVKKCSGRDKLQSQKPLVSQIMPDDAALRKQHTCRYCNKRFTYIKGVDLHYKRICAVRKVKEEENKLTSEDLAHEDELKRIIEHLKWSKSLNKDSSDIIQGNVRVEEDGTLTRVVKQRIYPPRPRKRSNKKRPRRSSVRKPKPVSVPLVVSSLTDAAALQVPSEETAEKVNEELTADENTGRRLTRSTSLDKSASSTDVGQKRKMLESPSSTGSAKKKGKSSSRRGSSETSLEERRETRNTSRIRKSIDDSSSKSTDNSPLFTKRSVDLKSNVKVVLKDVRVDMKELNSHKKATSRGPVKKDAEVKASKLPARKRGRPKIFDPSDIDTSYTKKKKVDRSLVRRYSSPNDTAKEDIVTKPVSSPCLPKSKPDPTEAGENSSQESLTSKGKSPRNSAQRPAQIKSKPKEVTPAKDPVLVDPCKMLEKMKQLKEAAKIESENQVKTKQAYQAKRAKLRKAYAALKTTTNSSVEGSANDSLSSNQKDKPVIKTQSTELFKHLTKEESKSPSNIKLLEGATPVSSKDKVIFSSQSKTSIVPVSTSLKRKSPITTSSPQDKKMISISSSKSVLNPSFKPKTVQYTPNKARLPSDLVSKKSESVVSSEKTEATGKQLTQPTKVLISHSKPVPVKTPPTLKFTPVSAASVGDGTSTLKQQPQPVSVRVVTLSPNGMNLLTYDSSSNNILTSTVSTLSGSKILKTQENIELVNKSPIQVLNRSSDQLAQPLSKGQPTNYVIHKPGQVASISKTGGRVVYKYTDINQTQEVSKPGGKVFYGYVDGRLVQLPGEEDPKEQVIYMYEDVSAPVLDTIAQATAAAGIDASSVAAHDASTSQGMLASPVDPVTHDTYVNNNTVYTVSQKTPKLTVNRAQHTVIPITGDQTLVQLTGGAKLPKETLLTKAGDKYHFINSSKLVTQSPTGTVGVTNTVLVPGKEIPTVIVAPRPPTRATPNITYLPKTTRMTVPSPRFPASTKYITLSGTNIVQGTAGQAKMVKVSTLPHIESIVSNQAIVPTASSTTITDKPIILNTGQMTRIIPSGVIQPPTTPKIHRTTQPLSTPINRPVSSLPKLVVQHASSSQPFYQTSTSAVANSPANTPSVGPANKLSSNVPRTHKNPLNSIMSNQIMISLDDGTTAMLDPDSLAQFLTFSPSLNKNDLSTITEDTATVTDPEHVMVNMAEIQPNHQVVHEINWPSNGSIDLTDIPDSVDLL